MAFGLNTAALKGEPSIGLWPSDISIRCSPTSTGVYLALMEDPEPTWRTGRRPLGPVGKITNYTN